MAKAKILGKLRGVIASAKERSRNGRGYTEGFWDMLFDSELFHEGIKNKVYLGQLFHPDDEEEYTQIHCDDRSAIVLVEVIKKGLDYIGTFEILPTKAGRCLRNLLDIGCVFGVSSRGLADYDAAVFDENIAKTYDLITWDIVAFPGLKICRLHEIGAVAEGFGYGKKKNKVKIMESLKQMQESDDFYKSYISESLKAKEDFDTELQVEDIMAFHGIDEDLASVGKYIVFDKDNKPYYDDGVHGNLEVMSDKAKDFKYGDIVLVDDIYYKDEGYYTTVGEWLKLN